MTRRRVVAVVKWLVALALVAAVAWHFTRLLTDPRLAEIDFTVRPEYLVPAGLLYLGTHTLWATFFVQLLRGSGGKISWKSGVRAYFVSQFGKYVPGKVWVIGLRMVMLRGQKLHPAMVGTCATYEALVSMAAGGMLAALLLPWAGLGLDIAVGSWTWMALVAIGVFPIMLGVLNRLVVRQARKYRSPDARPLTSPSLILLARGLLQASAGWCLLGLSLWLTIQGLSPNPAALSGADYIECLTATALSYVAGFVMFILPGGLGARELVLQQALARQLAGVAGGAAAPLAAVVALVLRLVWTAFEVVVSLSLWWFGRPVPAGVPAAVGASGGAHV
jgi:hypothetical protein